MPHQLCARIYQSNIWVVNSMPNKSFNADANIGHHFEILMANVGALRPYRASGAG